MLFEDFQKKKTKLTDLSVEYDGEKIEFFVKPIMGVDKEALVEALGDSLPILVKMEKAKAKGEKFAPDVSGKEYLQMQTAKKKYALYVWCKQDGTKQFSSYKAMVEKTPDELLELIADKIDNHKPADKSAEEIEQD